MIKAKNPGMIEAVELLKTLNLRKNLRYLHEERLKAIRDRKGEDEYVWDQGRAKGREEGKAEGKAESILQLLGEADNIPPELKTMIMAERDMDTLNRWLKAAARAESVEHFRRIMNN